MTARRGFTLAELMVVVCIIGILSLVAVPRYQEIRVRADAAALLARLRAVEEVYEGLGEPTSGNGLSATLGVVPPMFRSGLNPDAFQAEEGIRLVVSRSSGGQILLGAIARTPRGRAVLQALHHMLQTSNWPHTYSPSGVMTSLSPNSVQFIQSASGSSVQRRP